MRKVALANPVELGLDPPTPVPRTVSSALGLTSAHERPVGLYNRRLPDAEQLTKVLLSRLSMCVKHFINLKARHYSVHGACGGTPGHERLSRGFPKTMLRQHE